MSDSTISSVLTEKEKLFFIKVLTRLANVDNNIDNSEKSFIDQLFNSFQLPVSHLEEISTATDEQIINEAKNITNRQVAMELIKEMCILANLDGSLSDRETLLIGNIGVAMNLELEKIEQISRWVIDRIIWLEEGKVIFEKI
ncbi:MAG: hypothetical protein E7012_04540 [Alphaproteobacteria bacterium]|nr:hypothetical protein [Alphaproteobacteria bacterium]